MTKSQIILPAPLLFSLLGVAFCIWSGLGNDVNFCVTAGCTLYADTTIGGISLWWWGTAAFLTLVFCSIAGLRTWGRYFAALFVFGDIWFLALLAFTAPCVSCLCAGLLFAIVYFLFRKLASQPQRNDDAARRQPSILLWAWALFFVVNIGLVARSQGDVWAILDESGDPNTRMFFSPECGYCAEGISALGGNVEAAFYPVAENDSDVFRIAKMRDLIAGGMSIEDALAQSADFTAPKGLAAYSPDLLLLRFRLLRNKAHIFAAGSQKVPFFEQKGLPPELAARARAKRNASSLENPGGSNNGVSSYELPKELKNSGQCGGDEPCPPAFGN